MMDTGFIHHYFPHIFGYLSFIANSLFIFICLKCTRRSMGAYKYMLVMFGIFDMCYSTVDMVVSMGSHSEGNTFCLFISDGPFFNQVEAGFTALCIRCMFFSLSYGVLEVHFIYRYIALIKPYYLQIFTNPKWIIVIILGVFTQGGIWFCSVFIFLKGDDEMRSYLAEPIRRTYGVDVYKIAILGSTYWGASTELIVRTSIGILIITVISCFTIIFCIWVGWTIHKKLGVVQMSVNTKKMHRNLLRSLAVQTFIPFVISYLPCTLTWTVPLLHIDSKTLNNYAAMAVSIFPFIDPIAIILLLPEYRNALFNLICFWRIKDRVGPEASSQQQKGSSMGMI
ncbi:unnamed protein product [Caenorhabditis angaria]|uniref:G-protein coupled receptors family 1 profile domain-containing protein n=1 Tax=Caenorhabditis angaria TaxID=860376 RepID=A0A9P1N3W1_9PELO|nr:unnamed protein product [Caenorhabditis angaria]